MILIKVSIFGVGGTTLKDKHIELENGATVTDLLKALDIQNEKISMVIVNKQQVEKEYRLENNSEVFVVGFVGGG